MPQQRFGFVRLVAAKEKLNGWRMVTKSLVFAAIAC
jgi:hypothetical protein